MASETGSSSSVGTSSPAALIARQDRIPTWALSYLFIGIIGIGFLFTFYDIFDITVSFIQTCTQIVAGCTPANAANSLGLPVELNLVGYVVGALALAPLADRFGRRDMLLITLVLTGIGSLYTAFVGDYANFNIARIITGIGIGADLAIVNTYINEVAPRNSRAKYTSLIFIMSALGAFIGIWLGLILTTPGGSSVSFPYGLSFAQATATFAGSGWRYMYGIGAILALVGVLLRFQLPESPRWLISRGRVADAERVVIQMETHATRRAGELPPVADEIPVQGSSSKVPYSEILGNPLYLRRTLFLVVLWFFGYLTIYGLAQGLTTLLAGVLPLPNNVPSVVPGYLAIEGGEVAGEAGILAALGTFGFLASAIFAYLFSERLERKVWLPIAAVLTILGCLLMGFFTASNFTLAAIGSIVTFFGFNLWVPMTYTWTTEHYPTRARTTGFALGDSIGHLGGGVGILVLAGNIPSLLKSFGTSSGPVIILLIICIGIVVAAIIALFGTSTRNQRLDEVSP